MSIMSNTYPLQWLDSLILQTLNPKKEKIVTFSDNDLEAFSEKILKESNKVQLRIKNEIFSLVKKRQIRLQIRKYHANLIFLLDTVMENKNSNELVNANRIKLVNIVIGLLDELLSFLETRFSYYLSLDDRVPITYLIVSGKELKTKLNNLQLLLEIVEEEEERLKAKIVLDILSESIESKARSKITFRQILYERELLRALTDTEYEKSLSTFSSLDKILIEMNFNNFKYINFLAGRFLDKLNSHNDNIERLNFLQLCYKDLNHLNSNDKITFNPALENIKPILEKWFKNEIEYWEKSHELTLKTNSQDFNPIAGSSTMNTKIECDLSADQIALILRATDEARIIKARSMNHFFKMVVPHLSTPLKKDLSYSSVRSRSYMPEERDKEIAIKTLERIIKHIKDY